MKTITLNGVEIPVFFDGDDNQCDGMSIRIQESSFCEHCLELEPYDLEFFDGGVTWCESCMDHPVTEDAGAMAHLKAWEKQEKTKHYNARLRGLGEGPIDNNGEWDEARDNDWDGDEDSGADPDDRIDLLESKLETMENEITDLSSRLKKIEDFLREQEMAQRQDVITVGDEPRWVGPDPEDD